MDDYIMRVFIIILKEQRVSISILLKIFYKNDWRAGEPEENLIARFKRNFNFSDVELFY